jgi:hypothetical protein
MIKTTLKIAAAVSVFAVFFSCAKPPQKDVEAAKNGIQAAQSAQADLYVPETFKTAADNFNAAMDEIKTQMGKSAFSRNYDAAKKLLGASVKAAAAAKDAAAAEKDKMAVEVAEMLKQCEANIAAMGKTIEALAKNKKQMEKAEELKSGLEKVVGKLANDAKISIGEMSFAKAKAELDAALKEGAKLMAMIQEAKGPAKAEKGKKKK